jgi:hypothetical protein
MVIYMDCHAYTLSLMLQRRSSQHRIKVAVPFRKITEHQVYARQKVRECNDGSTLNEQGLIHHETRTSSSGRSMIAYPKASTSISSWPTMPPTRRPRSKRGLPAGRIIMSTSRRRRHHGSTKSNAGSLSSLERDSGAAFIPRSGSSKVVCEPSSTGTTKILSPSNGPNQSNPRLSRTRLPQNTADFMRRTLDSGD